MLYLFTCFITKIYFRKNSAIIDATKTLISSNLTSKIVRNMSQDKAKQAAGFKAVDDYVKDNMILGIGSGSTVVFVAQRLGELVKAQNLNLVCVPTSFQARQLIVDNKLKLGSLDEYPLLDIAIDGADEVDENLILIKGGGGCLTQEKIVASCAKYIIIVTDYTKKSRSLGENYKKIPIEVIPMAYNPVKLKIIEKFGGKPELRMAKMKMGPVVTDNGNFIIDWIFPRDNFWKKEDWENVNDTLKLIPGVVETGLFTKMNVVNVCALLDGNINCRNNFL